jgi:CubicO group peptidase (beta-lactamase class C family)
MIPDMTRVDVGLADAMARLLRSLVADCEPGLAVGAYRDGELVASATAGRAVVEHGVPITEHTAFDIASVSKHVTATCMLLLVRDGLVDLDTDVRATLPELSLAEPVTLRQCLTHTAGLRDYCVLYELTGMPTAGMTEDQAVRLIAGQRELDFPAGAEFSYSNSGYVLAAALLRRVTGPGLAQFAQHRVFGPLGMTATRFRDDVSLLVPDLANGYLVGPRDIGFRRCDVTENVVGDGAVVTTLADMARWHAFLATGTVIGTDIRDGLLTRQVLTNGTRLGYALGLDSVEIAGQEAWWHSGSWAGYRAGLIWVPQLRAGVTVLANRDDRYASHVALAVARALVAGEDPESVYAQLSGVPVPAERARSEAATIAGLWHEPSQDVHLQLAADDDGLADDAGNRYRLAADGRWHGVGGAAGQTYALGGGVLTALWGLSGRAEGRYERVPTGPAGSSQSPPLGIFRNEEFGADAVLARCALGELTVRIGLAGPRGLMSAGPGAWRTSGQHGGITIRLDRAAPERLLISLEGARRIRFDRVAEGPGRLGGVRGPLYD